MSAATLNYPKLVSEVQPQVIHNEKQNQRLTVVLRKLDSRWKQLSGDERKLYELLTLLIENYERKSYNLRAATPTEVIQGLMEANGLQRKDMVGVFESASVVSDVLNGKRALTVDHIRRLSERFSVSPAVFF